MASKIIRHLVKGWGINVAEWVAETLASAATGDSPGWRSNIVRFQISAYGLAKRLNDKTGMGNKRCTNMRKYFMQTIEEVTPHREKFQHRKNCVQTDHTM
jgi:hypothetical protein